MNKEFDKFKQWLSLNYSDGLLDLNPPATDAQIEELTIALGVDLPKDFIDVLRIHNGQKGESAWLFDSQEFLSTHRIIEEFNIWKNLLNSELKGKLSTADEGVKNDWYNLNWIPFTTDGCGNHYCFDLSPSPTGKKVKLLLCGMNQVSEKLYLGVSHNGLKNMLKNYLQVSLFIQKNIIL